ncbi:restriction endonuclease subunit S [Proteus mirabilis]|uniref:restriction endonuclease subunit S n=1 Tax=Proteus mirabilis TaxID=584 RepID=UPI001FACF088|nr:restriction endonuclease subunit S [Proteus mirabilis]MCI9780095.1 restriction endonuclease subunit S [Proteus mirabilis]
MVPNSISKLDLVQAQISEIPEDWQLCKVSEALRIRNNFRKPISQEVRETMKGQYPYYGPTKIQDYISEYEQDGIYALIGEDGDHFLKYATMPQTQFISGKCTVNNHAHILESSSICDSEWFFNYFKHRNITNFLSRQGAGRFKLNKATLEKLPLLVPPLPEQRKIAQILSTWDRGIATTEKLIDASKQQKKALMQQLLTGKKRLIDPETGKAFEGEWEEVKLSEIVEVSNKKSTKSNQFPVITSSRKGIYLQEEYFKKQVASEDNTGYKLVPRGYITYRAMSDDGLFRFNIQCMLDNSIISPAYGVFKFKDSCNSSFCLEVMNTKQTMSKINRLSQGGTRISFKTSSFKEIPFVLPSLPEQQKIASVLTTADKEIELLEAKLAHLKQEKKALMQQLLTGKRRVSLSS